MNETLTLARGLATASGRRLAAERLAKHLRADALMMFVRDPDADRLIAAPGFPQLLPGGPSWVVFLARCQDLGVHEGKVEYPDATQTVPYRALVQRDGVLMLLGGEPEVDEWVDLAASFLFPTMRAEHLAALGGARVSAALDAAKQTSLLTASLDSARAELERVTRELRIGNEERARLLTILGEDLGNPLAAITMTATLLVRRRGLTVEQNEAVKRIQRMSERMGGMIRALQDRERLRTNGSLLIEPRVVRAGELVRKVNDDSRLAHPGVRFELDNQLGDVEAYWDRARISLLLTNLLCNAAQHGARTVPILTHAHKVDDTIVIVVSNPLEAPIGSLEALFEPFFRGKKSLGLGLGLYVGRAIARAHDGSLTASSDGKTIHFTLRLPANSHLAGSG